MGRVGVSAAAQSKVAESWVYTGDIQRAHLAPPRDGQKKNTRTHARIGIGMGDGLPGRSLDSEQLDMK